MTVGEMLARVTSAELTEWMAFDAIEPFGEFRADLRAGIIASVTANYSMNAPSRPRRPSDYMPFETPHDGLTRTSDGSILLEDPKEQAKLIEKMVFGVKEK